MHKIGRILPVKGHNMKFIALIILVLLLSCSKKDTRVCYNCTITYIMTTDTPVDGYPYTTNVDVEICDVTLEQVDEFEKTNKGSESYVIGGITYSYSYSTKCVVK
jgi:hypothetical protein